MSVCWCCGAERAESELLHLDQHPEVGVCARCARWLHRRARQREDEQRPSPAAWLRGGIRSARSVVIQHHWQDRPVIGPLLRRLDRHLP